MICPQTKAECAHNCSAWMISCKEAVKPPPPTLAEIEGLVDAFVRKIVYFERDPMQYKRDEMNEARAALMAAIQKYGS